MRIVSAQLAEEFVLFLESHDGESWNKLAAVLHSVYVRSRLEDDFAYLPNAVSFAANYAIALLSAFGSASHYHIRASDQIALIAYTATQIAIDFLAEFLVIIP
jgi:hypothetical protein